MNNSTSKISIFATLFTTPFVLNHQANAAIIHADTNLNTSLNVPLSLDINTDGYNDIKFHNSYSSSYYSSYWSRSSYSYYDLYAEGLNGALITLGGPLSFGDLIDDSLDFGISNHLADYDNRYSSWYSCGRRYCSSGSSRSTNTYGTWNDDLNSISGYLGFSLLDGTDTIFGWANLSMQATGATTIHEYAYESCAGTGIRAGQQSSLCQTASAGQASSVPEPSPIALLALGAVGIGIMKRQRIKHI